MDEGTESTFIRRGTSVSLDPVVAAAELHDAIGQPNISFALFFCSSDYDLDVLGAELARRFQGIDLIGCTTSGEITPGGYLRGSLTGVSIASNELRAVSRRLDELSSFQFSDGKTTAAALISDLEASGQSPTGESTFGLLLIDGLRNQEDLVVAALSRALGSIQLFGGSAGDGTRFHQTHVFHDGRFHTDAAVFALVHTSLPFTVFRTQHFESSSQKMVVTRADPARRIVTEINAEPAGREYARMVGLEVDELTPLIFSTYPVVVRIGGAYYVRSIQKVNPDESLTFFCAIDEGIVLTVARGVDLVQNLVEAFEDVRRKVGDPLLIVGCDCILRSLELDQKGIREDVGAIFAASNVIGFATYGEQFNAMHMNQTFTGVAIGRRAR